MRDEIIKMARKAGIEFDLIDEDEGQIWYITTETLERFFHMAQAAEREACAKVCDEWAMFQLAFDLAGQIRARGQA